MKILKKLQTNADKIEVIDTAIELFENGKGKYLCTCMTHSIIKHEYLHRNTEDAWEDLYYYMLPLIFEEFVEMIKTIGSELDDTYYFPSRWNTSEMEFPLVPYTFKIEKMKIFRNQFE